jgi:hypothetical protein
MTSSRLEFKRVVVGLPQCLAGRAAIDAAADLAELLHIELLAAFIEDPTLRGLALFPAVRELRTLDQAWQAIDAVQIAREIDHITEIARRRFADAVRSRSIKTGFDVVVGAEMAASLIRTDDIVAIIEPTHAGEKITRQFTGLLDAALASAAAILVVPRKIVHATGPVLAVATGPEDLSIWVAREIAAALKEQLIIATRPGALLPHELFSDAGQIGVQLEQMITSGTPAEVPVLVQSLARSKERLRIIGRNQLSVDSTHLFSNLRGIPLLVVGLDRTRSAKQQENRQVH